MSDQPAKILTPDDTLNFGNAAAPTGPPEPRVRQISERFREVERFIEGITADEGLVLDICLTRAARIVEEVHNSGMAGIDFFVENNQAPRTVMVSLAVPLAAKLYERVCASLDTPENAEKLLKLVEQAQAKKA